MPRPRRSPHPTTRPLRTDRSRRLLATLVALTVLVLAALMFVQLVAGLALKPSRSPVR